MIHFCFAELSMMIGLKSVVLTGLLSLGVQSLAGAQSQGAASPVDQPEELGQVHWARDHDLAFSKARAANKPLLLLFQEIPG